MRHTPLFKDDISNVGRTNEYNSTSSLNAIGAIADWMNLLTLLKERIEIKNREIKAVIKEGKSAELIPFTEAMGDPIFYSISSKGIGANKGIVTKTVGTVLIYRLNEIDCNTEDISSHSIRHGALVLTKSSAAAQKNPVQQWHRAQKILII